MGVLVIRIAMTKRVGTSDVRRPSQTGISLSASKIGVVRNRRDNAVEVIIPASFLNVTLFGWKEYIHRVNSSI